MWCSTFYDKIYLDIINSNKSTMFKGIIEMSVKWEFPSNDYGILNGIGEAGIETFKGLPYRSLAREICQNSLDAALVQSQPVRVEFMSSFLLDKDIPDFDALKKALKLCYEFWAEQKNKKTMDFFQQAMKVSENTKISLLRISDFNTTGLTGSDQDYNTPWQNLVKASGVSDKAGFSGGSFGIGKSAPFACSDLRTVFYATQDKDGLKAFQGIARLVSFKKKGFVGLNADEISTGIGYYGETRRKSAIRECISLDQRFSRNQSGTDVFILGFQNKDNWKNEMVKSVLEDFLCAIYEGKLIVRIQEIEISKRTLAEVIEDYKEEAKTAYNYYQVLISPETEEREFQFEDLGKVKFYLLIQKNLHRRVLMSRSNGMKVFDQKNISSTIQFAGICVLNDNGINSYFREMENPQHNAWEPERHHQPKEAKKKKQSLARQIKNIVIEFGKNTTVDEMDAEGMGEFLPDNMIESSQREGEKEETVTDRTKDIDIVLSNLKTAQRGFEKLQVGKSGEEEEVIGAKIEIGTGESGGRDYGEDNPHKTKEGSSFGKEERDGNGTNGIGNTEYAVGNEDENREEIVRHLFEVHIMSVRMILVDARQKKYRLIFKPQKNAKSAYLQLQLSGEQKNVDVNILSAVRLDNQANLKCAYNKIYLDDIVETRTLSVEFCIAFSEPSSMEVSLYGYPL